MNGWRNLGSAFDGDDDLPRGIWSRDEVDAAVQRLSQINAAMNGKAERTWLKEAERDHAARKAGGPRRRSRRSVRSD